MKKLFFLITFICLASFSMMLQAQNVGIGSTVFTPNYLLHINHSAASGTIFQITNTTTGTATTDGFQISFNTSGNTFQLNNREAGDIAILTNNTERLRITSDSGILLANPVDYVYHNFSSTKGYAGYGFRSWNGHMQYKHKGGIWADFPTMPNIPGNVEWWIRPTAASYIRPMYNPYIRVYDTLQTYGLYFDGGKNQYGGWFRTTSGVYAPTAAVVGYSDVAGNQTYAYLGYNGSYSDGLYFPAISGAAVYGVVDDPDRISVFGRTTGLASYAAIIGYSNTWIPGYFKGRHYDPTYAARPAVYGQMQTETDVSDYQPAVKGYSSYTGSSTTATTGGKTVGGSFIAVGGTQDAYGVVGLADCSGTAKGVGIYGESSDNVSGSDYYSSNIGAIEGNGAWGTTTYNFGVCGRVAGSGLRQGGVIGTYWTTDWGALGYNSSANVAYGLVYLGGSTTGAKSINQPVTGIGMGGYGGVFGGWVRGDIYGLNIMGQRYGLYVHGTQYNNGDITILNDVDKSDDRIASHVASSMKVDIYDRGIAEISNGGAKVTFSPEFSMILSESEPVIVTVTPIGAPAELYIVSSDNNGFYVQDNSAEKRAVKFSWIAIGTKQGFENPVVCSELIPDSYENNMKEVMSNESDPTVVAKPVWWDGSKLRFDQIPASLLNKQQQSKSSTDNPDDAQKKPTL